MTEPRIEDFLRLEAKVWQALADGDPEEDARLLSDDFLGVYPTGFADRSDHTAQLVDGPTIATFALHDARLVSISESAAILSYRADYEHARTTAAGEAESMSVRTHLPASETPGGHGAGGAGQGELVCGEDEGDRWAAAGGVGGAIGA